MRSTRWAVLFLLFLLVPTDVLAVVGRPLTPVSYAGVARRTTRRAAYASAATTSAVVATPAPVATTAAIATLPTGCATSQVGGATYYQCGSTWYRPAYDGPNLVYVSTAPP